VPPILRRFFLSLFSGAPSPLSSAEGVPSCARARPSGQPFFTSGCKKVKPRCRVTGLWRDNTLGLYLDRGCDLLKEKFDVDCFK